MDDHDRAEARLVGRGRNPRRIAAALARGSSVVIAGSLGSGRSHLIRAVMDELIAAGATPIIVRTGAPLAERSFGALDASGDRRLAQLREGVAPAHGVPVPLIVDDAHLLDEHSARTLLAGVYAGHITALFSVRVPRVRAGRQQDPHGVGKMIIDLWLHDAVDRIDLDELDAGEAEALLDHFPGADRLDTVARAMVVALADGSRMLLRELSVVAISAVIAGKDPVDALRDIRPHSRVGDAVSAHVEELGDDDRRALAFLGRVPGIHYADAIRFVSSRVVDDLIAGGLVGDDGTAHRRLTANWLLAREAARGAEATASVEALEVTASERMLDAGGEWWSSPIASMIAARWHEGRCPARSGGPLAPALRARVALDAARAANDEGRAALALAYAALSGDEQDSLGLALDLDLERRFAAAILEPTDRTRRALAALDPLTLDGEVLLRYVRMRAHIVSGRDLTVLCGSGMIDRASGQSRAELAVAAAEAAALNMDWRRARDASEQARGTLEVSASTRVRAMVVGALSETHLGSWSAARVLFDKADALCHPPSGPVTVRGTERVLALCIELLASTLAGAEPAMLSARLRAEALSAARHGATAVVALVGFCASLLHALAGNTDMARRELAAAIHRSRTLPLGPYVPLVELTVAQALVVLGDVDSGRTILAREARGGHRSSREGHLRLTANLSLAAAAGDISDAVAFGRQAAAASVAGENPALRLRDFYHLAALGERDPQLLEQIQQLGGSLDLPVAPVLVSRAQGMFRARRSMARLAPLELLRLGAPWSVSVPRLHAVTGMDFPALAPSAGARPLAQTPIPGAPDYTIVLTPREREIVELVAQGLSNRAIAERLYLSVRTVESHVYQARLKTGAPSRADFARLFGRRRPRTDGPQSGHGRS